MLGRALLFSGLPQKPSNQASVSILQILIYIANHSFETGEIVSEIKGLTVGEAKVMVGGGIWGD